MIDEEAYYADLMSGLRVGTNGYLLVKTSTGRIVMHPDRSQWGIDVIRWRLERYPGLDLESLSEMVERQIAEPSGVYEYYSYWWTHPELPRVKKISTHVHADLGDDFWVVSAVVDYSDFYAPHRRGRGPPHPGVPRHQRHFAAAVPLHRQAAAGPAAQFP